MAVYNQIYSKEKFSRVYPENRRILEDFVIELRQTKKSDGTIKQYTNDIRMAYIYMLDYCDNKSVLEMTRRDFRGMSMWFSDTCHMSAARVNRILSSLRSLLDFVEDEEEYNYNNNVTKRVKGLPKKPVREICFLSNDSIMKLEERLLGKKEYQKATLVMLLYDSAARRNEVAQVKKYSFMDKNKSCTNKVTGKRGKVFPLIYHSETKRCAELWLKQRGDDGIDELFILEEDGEKRPASDKNIYKWIVGLRKEIEAIDGKHAEFNVHSFRHSAMENYSTGTHYFCIEHGMKGISLERLSKLANHSNISTTQGYLKDKSMEELEEVFGISLSD